MIESNDEKTFICVSFYTVDEKLCEYEKNFGEKSKSRDKLLQFGTPGQHTKNLGLSRKNRDSWNVWLPNTT